MSSQGQPFDIIFAGGGTTACVVAGRLAAADPSLRILIIEAGPATQDDLAHTQPARYATHLLPDSKTIKVVEASPSEYVGGRAVAIVGGQCLGGGSSVNFVTYTRASASDYDDWETKHGNPGWGYKDMLPYLKKFETYDVDPGLDTHGYSGPIKVSRGGLYGNVGNDFLDVAPRYDTQRNVVADPNGLVSGCNAYGRWPKYINGQTGSRSDAAHHYIYTQTSNQNLVISTGYFVKRIIFEDNRAVGVEYVPDPRTNASGAHEVLTARATRLVVVSAGSLGSPLVLERSGVGSKSLLTKLGIPVIADLPGVGDKYQDHQGLFPPYFASDESLTLDGIVRGDQEELDRWTLAWEKGTGLLASNGLDAGIKLRPSETELKEIGPAFASRWSDFYVPAPDKPAIFFGPLAVLVGDPSTAPARKYFTIEYFVEHPASFGHIHIMSAEDVAAPPDFDPAFLTKPEDLALLVWGYKRSRELARRMPCYRGEYAPSHPKFPEDSEAACKASALPVAPDAPDIRWTAEDDKAIEEYTRAFVASF
ncbi:hypothetical protein EIP91_007313 [Steccherinum ochraceum]|uniref:Glucose-methanol-choline oxidoreductase N-terminal domain-containing protein n=1 Tax=Steccherinum ochraceum TaxID=92696 RepID=A0A4R0RU91_9APHY|nr:hypothetical protein EIP91_007313 [Steccherinum ochraceum]